jgi:hypothetical protein
MMQIKAVLNLNLVRASAAVAKSKARIATAQVTIAASQQTQARTFEQIAQTQDTLGRLRGGSGDREVIPSPDGRDSRRGFPDAEPI